MVAKTEKGCAWSKSKRKKPAKQKKKIIVFEKLVDRLLPVTRVLGITKILYLVSKIDAIYLSSSCKICTSMEEKRNEEISKME